MGQLQASFCAQLQAFLCAHALPHLEARVVERGQRDGFHGRKSAPHGAEGQQAAWRAVAQASRLHEQKVHARYAGCKLGFGWTTNPFARLQTHTRC